LESSAAFAAVVRGQEAPASSKSVHRALVDGTDLGRTDSIDHGLASIGFV
jgi:hypothetical protein